MARYLMRRLLMAIPVLWGISLLLFTLLALAPGDPLGEFVLNPNIPPEVRANLRQQFGLDDPVLLRYGRWFTAMLHGDWGYSFVSRVPALTLIVQRLPTTLFVMGAAYGLAVLIAFPVGILSALKPSPSNVHLVLDFLGYDFRSRDVVTVFVCRSLRWFLLGTARMLLVTS
jgi:peptide/nickel transport system permease protein